MSSVAAKVRWVPGARAGPAAAPQGAPPCRGPCPPLAVPGRRAGGRPRALGGLSGACPPGPERRGHRGGGLSPRGSGMAALWRDPGSRSRDTPGVGPPRWLLRCPPKAAPRFAGGCGRPRSPRTQRTLSPGRGNLSPEVSPRLAAGPANIVRGFYLLGGQGAGHKWICQGWSFLIFGNWKRGRCARWFLVG